MAHTFNIASSNAISMGDYVDLMRNQFDVKDPESLKESAVHLHALSQNRTIFTQIVTDAVKANASKGGLQESFNAYTDATFLLDGCPDRSFYIRANVWKKELLIAGRKDRQKELYSYDSAHDHNFDFMTVGYYGTGYTTRIYEYDHTAMVGAIGEPIDIRFLEETTLPVGKVMMYRKSQDIHTQIPPSETSISLNLMIPPSMAGYKEQLFFDVQNGALGGFASGPTNYQVSIIRLAADLGDSALLDPLLAIAVNSVSARTRAAAVEAALAISPELRARLLTLCGSDASPLVTKQLI